LGIPWYLISKARRLRDAAASALSQGQGVGINGEAPAYLAERVEDDEELPEG
jgi:hypothetical protein